MAVSAVMVAAKTGMGVLLSRRLVFDNSGIEEVGGVDQQAFLIAPAHVRSHSNYQNYQNCQSSQPKNQPSKGFIFEEGLSL